MKENVKEIIAIGYTNKSYKCGNFFCQEKNKNGLNHLTNYNEIQALDFVPKLIEDNETFSKWEWIEGKHLDDLKKENIIKLANTLHKLHNSDIKLAKFNLKKRVQAYRKIMQEKNIKIEIIEKLYRKINLILAKMDKTKPVHGDLYKVNIIIRNKDQKIFFVDWEYSHMGDIHYELAYIIEAYQFDQETEKIFLNTYHDYDPHLLRKHKVFVNYLTVLWLYAQKELFFSPKSCLERLEKFYDEGF